MTLRHTLTVAFLLAIGLTAVTAAPDADPAKLEALIRQLGSPSFPEREAATRELDAIGAPALEELTKAAKAAAPEARRRAEELIARIERRVQSEQLRAPKRVRLALKDVPVPEAVAELSKQSGYLIALGPDADRFKDRKVTLDTGDTTFWEALDKLCMQAGVVESTSVEVPLRAGNPAARPRIMPTPQLAGAQLVLVDGKLPEFATHYAGGARIRTLPPKTPLYGPARRPDELLFGLGVSFEPRIQFQSVVGVRIDKARDDQDQNLEQTMMSDPAAAVGQPVFIGNVNGVARGIVGTGPQQAAVRLKAGAKPARTIKELTGVVTAEVRTPPAPVITVDDVLKAVGKPAKGKDGGSLTVLDVTNQKDGQVQIRVDLQVPPEPANAGVNGNIRRIQIMPALPVAPAAPPGQGMQVQIQQIQIQQIGGGGGIFIGPGGFNNDGLNLSLVDDKDRAFQLVGIPSRTFKVVNNAVSNVVTLVFKPQPGQGAPAKLHYSTTRLVTVDVPFTLKDIPLE